jgi:hypothetical protein
MHDVKRKALRGGRQITMENMVIDLNVLTQ